MININEIEALQEAIEKISILGCSDEYQNIFTGFVLAENKDINHFTVGELYGIHVKTAVAMIKNDRAKG